MKSCRCNPPFKFLRLLSQCVFICAVYSVCHSPDHLSIKPCGRGVAKELLCFVAMTLNSTPCDLRHVDQGLKLSSIPPCPTCPCVSYVQDVKHLLVRSSTCDQLSPDESSWGAQWAPIASTACRHAHSCCAFTHSFH